MHTITNLDGGTAGASIELARNRHANSDLLVDTTGWGHFGGAALFTVTRSVLPNGEVNTPRPGACATFTATAEGVGSANLGDAIPVTPGETITASFYIRRGGSAWDARATPRLDWSNGTRAFGAVVSLLNGSYSRLTVTGTAPEGVTTARLNVLFPSMPAGSVFRARMAQIETGTEATEYLDGATANLVDEDIYFDFVGAYGLSPSIKRLQTWSILNRTRPLAVSGYTADRASRNVFHDLLDGTIGVSFVPPRPRAGTLVTVYESRVAAFEALNMYSHGRLFRYATTDLPEVGMDFALDGRLGIEQDNEAAGVWYVLVGYQEV